ncbi:GPI mannosyltransferase 1 [Malassezia sp. CBS 17886]|nr:GPI mannosyltransferase 1 [Malassezia sp. CBS 17886]
MDTRRWRLVYLALGVLLRVILLVWGHLQDRTAAVPYTDVDYAVFNDGAHALIHGCPLAETLQSGLYEEESDLFDVPELAARVSCARGFLPAVARFVLHSDPGNGTHTPEAIPDSSPLTVASKLTFTFSRPLFTLLATLGDPYARPTYRYTPLLAALLAPLHRLGGWQWGGKVLFAAADIACAVLMWCIVDQRALRHVALARAGARGTHLPGLLWLLNPFPAQIATRGSAESLVGVLVLGAIWLLLRATPELALVPESVGEASGEHRAQAAREERMAADEPQRRMEARSGDTRDAPAGDAVRHAAAGSPRDLRVVSVPAFYTSAVLLALAVHVKLYPVVYGTSILAHLAGYRRRAIRILCGMTRPSAFQVHVLGVWFAVCAAAAYFIVTGAVWLVWGRPFLVHALLYHLRRQDHRHNFSVYFLPTYLGATGAAGGGLEPLLTPTQSALASFVPQLLATGLIGLWMGGQDLVMSCAVQTLVFVAWNKVYTSQYFLWYLWFVPIVGTTMYFPSHAHIARLLIVWVAAQVCWLYYAYQLEFRAQDTFVALWLSSLGLLAVHTYCAHACLSAWTAWRARAAVVEAKAE